MTKNDLIKAIENEAYSVAYERAEGWLEADDHDYEDEILHTDTTDFSFNTEYNGKKLFIGGDVTFEIRAKRERVRVVDDYCEEGYNITSFECWTENVLLYDNDNKEYTINDI